MNSFLIILESLQSETKSFFFFFAKKKAARTTITITLKKIVS